MPVLIDNCVVLSVKVHALFLLNGELISTTINKQKYTIFVKLRGAFICFILCNVILSSKVCFDRTGGGTVISWQTWSLIFLEALWRLAGASVTLGFSSQTRKKAFTNFLLESYQRKKNEETNVQKCTHKALLCYAYTVMFFWCLLTFLKCIY